MQPTVLCPPTPTNPVSTFRAMGVAPEYMRITCLTSVSVAPLPRCAALDRRPRRGPLAPSLVDVASAPKVCEHILNVIELAKGRPKSTKTS